MHIRGLESGRKVTVWNQDTGTPLVHAYADRTPEKPIASPILYLHLDTSDSSALGRKLDLDPL